jgi:Domain of unknown function (DUF4062)
MRRVVKVFLASPGDLADERRAAKAIADEFNALLAEELGYQVELVGWEDTISEAGRPQAIINRDLERCEVFIGMMWRRWGTPPDNNGQFSSGFEEEFRTSIDRHRRTGQPAVSLLFKEIDPRFLEDPGEDLKKVLAFRDDLVAKKELLFERFGEDPSDFAGKFRRCITRHVLRLKSQENENRVAGNQSTTTDQAPPASVAREESDDENPLSRQGASFLRKLTSTTDAKGSVSSVDISRLRLLSTVLWEPGNDEVSIGVHDANLLYVNAKSLDLSGLEKEALLKGGLAHFSQEVAPVWRWFASIENRYADLLLTLSMIGFDDQRVGALEAMRLVGDLSEPERPDSSPALAEMWLIASSDAVRSAAIEYLQDFGHTEDIGPIRKEFERNKYQTSAKAAAAIVSISLRDGRAKAIRALYELRPAALDDDLIDQIFASTETIDTETLIQGLDQPNVKVRRRIASLLRSRKELSTELAEKLLNDADASVRYEALKSLEEGGRAYTEETMKPILVKPTSSGFGFLYGTSDKAGEEKLEQTRWETLRKLGDDALTAMITVYDVFDRRAEFVLAERHFRKRAAALRRNVVDGYKQDFDLAVSRLEAVVKNEDMIQKVRSFGEDVRKRLTRRALDVITRKGGPADLMTVRAALDDPSLDYSPGEIEFLGRFGEWEDISRIVKRTSSGVGLGSSLLGSNNDERFREGARAILSLSKNRLKDVLAVEMPTALLTRVISESSDTAFRGLEEGSVLELLRSESDSVRKVAALRAVRNFSRKRVTGLLSTYLEQGRKRYFYNVVHWLDLGVSLGRAHAVGAASKALREMEASRRMGGGRFRRRRR